MSPHVSWHCWYPCAAPLTPDMASCQRIRDCLSSPAATCRRNQRGCRGTRLSWLVPGHGCYPRPLLLSHRLPWPVQLLSLTQPCTTGWRKRLQTLPVPAVSWGHSCPTHGWEQDPTVLLSASATKEGPELPPALLAQQEPSTTAVRNNVVLSGTCFFTSSSRSSESPGPQVTSHGPADVGCSRADAGAAWQQGHRQGWAEVGLSHALAVE